jgi:hypothetical protein
MKLDADWIVGFTDAEGCFSVRPSRNTIRCEFCVSQDERSKHVLFAIKAFFGVGNVHRAGGLRSSSEARGTMWVYSVGNLTALQSVIIPFFETNRLHTSKYCTWLKFRSAVLALHSPNTMLDGQNSTYESIETKPMSASWFIGFVDGEGCFTVSIVTQYPRPQFLIGIHHQDQSVCEGIQSFLGCGLVYKRKNGVVVFQISRRRDLIHSLFPVLYTRGNCHCLRTQKRRNASLFRRIVLAMERGFHLRSEGLAQIRQWKERMRFVRPNGTPKKEKKKKE